MPADKKILPRSKKPVKINTIYYELQTFQSPNERASYILYPIFVAVAIHIVTAYLLGASYQMPAQNLIS